jgi:dual specificity tyrosine-phosphorylation-regulated kinase 1
MKALDHQTKEHVAIKIIKARRAYSQQARREIKLLQDLRAADTDGSSNVVELRGHFVFNNPGVGNHECLVFEMLSSNLYTLLEQVQFHGFSLPLVRKFSEALLRSLAFLARSDVRVIHTDMKPENICIRNPKRSAIKLIDFGSSCTEGQQLFSYIQSRYYRSPEVLLGCGYTVAIDVWSLACVLVEMHSGTPLFSGENHIDQVRKIMALCGPPPDAMIDCFAEEKRTQLFKPASGAQAAAGQARWAPLDPPSTRNLDEVLGVYSGGPSGRWLNENGHSAADYLQFKDLIGRMLSLDPTHRLRPDVGLTHPFITQDYPGSPTDLKQQAAQRQATTTTTCERSSSSTRHSSRRSGASSSSSSSAASSSSSGVASSAVSRSAERSAVPHYRRASEEGGSGGHPHSGEHVMSEQHHAELAGALIEIGCPTAELSGSRPLNWESISDLLEAYAQMDEEALGEAHRRFLEFMSQPLRARQKKALQHLLDLLRESHNNNAGASHLSGMETEATNANTPIP